VDPLEAQLLLIRLLFLALTYGFLAAVGLLAWREAAAPRPAARRSADAPGPRLIVIEGGASDRAPGSAFVLDLVTAVGRDLDNQVVLQDPTVSGRHAVIHHRDGAWWAEDLGSTNGTRINGRPADILKPELLRSGDLIQFGSVRLRLISPDL
jgi:hypothetical protein